MFTIFTITLSTLVVIAAIWILYLELFVKDEENIQLEMLEEHEFDYMDILADLDYQKDSVIPTYPFDKENPTQSDSVPSRGIPDDIH